MLNKKMVNAFNRQINAELFSSYLYLSMAGHFKDSGLDGLANWMEVQAKEELWHGMKFYAEINERGGRVALAAIEAPEDKWASPLAAFEAVYAHEQKVTALIGGLVELAQKEKDHAAQVFLQWFVTEQVEEEANAKALVDQLRLVGDNPQGLFMIDRELRARTFVMPVPAAG